MTRALRSGGIAVEKKGRKRQNGTCLFQLLLFVFEVLLILACAQAQDSQCTSDDVDAYVQCVANNPCICSNCDPNPLDNTPVINVDTPPEDCRDVNRLFCPLIRCCSVCEDVARSWYECPFQAFALETLGVECSATCDGYNNGDVEGECEPSLSPAPSLAPSDLPIGGQGPVNSSIRPTMSSIERPSDFPSSPPSSASQAAGNGSGSPTSGCQSNRQNAFVRFSIFLHSILLTGLNLL